MYAFLIEPDGESANSKFEQEHSQTGPKMAKNLTWQRLFTSLVPGVKNSLLPNGLEQLRQVTLKGILADHEHFESLAWLCMISMCHYWRHKCSPVPFSRCLLNISRSFFWSWPRAFIIRFCEKIYQTRAYPSGVMFLCKWRCFNQAFLKTPLAIGFTVCLAKSLLYVQWRRKRAMRSLLASLQEALTTGTFMKTLKSHEFEQEKLWALCLQFVIVLEGANTFAFTSWTSGWVEYVSCCTAGWACDLCTRL